ncbi:MAG: hypothetical protein WDZ31_07495 [Phycisphaeraceae bacterium]
MVSPFRRDVLVLLALIVPMAVLLATPMVGVAADAEQSHLGTHPQWTRWSEQASQSPAYLEATAHEPRFEDDALWPMLQGQEAFAEQRGSEQGRAYRWAHPGRNGGARWRGALDPTDPSNWIDLATGERAEQLILDEHTDLVLPASEEPYKVGFRDTGVQENLRHVTINPGAAFIGGGDGVGRTIHGNVWLKRGGAMDAQGATRFVGTAETFFRNDNTYSRDRSGRGEGTMCSQYFTFEKDESGSIEFLGHTTVLDEFRINGCTVIVGRYSKLQPGRHAAPAISGGGTLALLDYAYFGKWTNDFGQPCLVVEGVVQGGLPERPLTAPATLGIGFKNYTEAEPDTDVDEKLRNRALPRVAGLVLESGSVLRSYSEAPDEACLRITSMWELGYTSATRDLVPPEAERRNREQQFDRDSDQERVWAWFLSLPRGIDVFLGQDVEVRRVTFDHVREGGLLTPDPAALQRRWEGVSFGPGCEAEGAALFTRIESLERGGRY